MLDIASESGRSKPSPLKTGLTKVAGQLPEMLLLFVLGFFLLVFLRYGWRVVFFPYPLDYGEGPILDQVVRLAQLQNIYRSDLAVPPYTIANYPPLYLLVQVPLNWIFGPAFWYGRLISLISIVASAVFITLIVHSLTSDWPAAVVSGLVFLVTPYVSFWSPLFRVDSLALGLSLAAVLIVVRWPDGRWSLVTTALLLTAAVYTRQSYGLAAPITVFCWLLVHRPRHRAFMLVALVGSLGLVLFTLLNLLTGGGFFFNIVTANVNEFDVAWLVDWLNKVWDSLPYLLVGSALFLLLAGWFRVRSWRLLAPYLVGAAVSGLTIGKAGAWVNYLFEFSAAMSMAVGASMAHLRKRLVVRCILALVLAIQVFHLWPDVVSYRQPVESKIEQREELDELMRIVHEADGAVLADEHMGLLPLDHRSIYIQPFEMAQLARSGVWDQAPFLKAVERQEFAAILIFIPLAHPLHRDRWTPEALLQIDQYYEPVGTVGLTSVYRPK
jgi:4-amino-4-deoxy-L-arabinose transferase-like glycosyltransferase